MKLVVLKFMKAGFFFIVTLTLLNGCKKDNNAPSTTTPPFTLSPSPCRLTDEEKNILSVYEHYWYTYTSDGKVDSIYYSQVPGGRNSYVAWCKEDSDGFVWYTYQNTNGQKPDQFDYLYSSLIKDSTSFPASLATSYQVYTDPNTPGYGYSFQYKADGRLDGYQQTAPFITGALIGMGVEYSGSGDISTMDYNVTTGPRNHSQVIAGGYDGHPTPWAGITGWVFLTPAVQWTSPDYDELLFTLSSHNPANSSLTDNTGAVTQTETLSYEYNSAGQPTKRTIVRKNPGIADSLIYTENYTYDCK